MFSAMGVWTSLEREMEVAKIAKPTVETSVKVRLNLEKFVWSSREK
jgi:hypothetical protein